MNLIPDGSSVFDIGCGNGQFLFLLEKFCKISKLMGVEISENLVDACNRQIVDQKIMKVKAIKYNGKDIPNEISTYNVITMIDVFHHVPKDMQFQLIKNIFNAMKQNDIFIMKDIDADSCLVCFNKLNDLLLSKQFGHEISSKIIKSFLLEIGFEVTFFNKMCTLVYPHYLISAKKI
jgi:cyclopropane fatty-acyl-phospholipid synthase-like methyltransferase